MAQNALLITTRPFSPYAVNEVFGWPVEEVKTLIEKAEGAIRVFDPIKDAEALAAMSGKVVTSATSEIEAVHLDPKTLKVAKSGK